MRDAVFRILAGVLSLALAVMIVLRIGPTIDAVRAGGFESLWWTGMYLVLTSSFGSLAVLGPEKAHRVLARGVRLMGLGRGDVPERLGGGPSNHGKEIGGQPGERDDGTDMSGPG